MIYYVRLGLRKWENAFGLTSTVTVPNVLVVAKAIGFLEVYDSLEILLKEYPDADYIVITDTDGQLKLMGGGVKLMTKEMEKRIMTTLKDIYGILWDTVSYKNPMTIWLGEEKREYKTIEIITQYNGVARMGTKEAWQEKNKKAQQDLEYSIRHNWNIMYVETTREARNFIYKTYHLIHTLRE